MIMIIPFKCFSARQSLGTVKASEFGAVPANGCKEYDEADAKWKLFLVQHDLSRALDGQCEQRLRDIKGMRSSSDREYEFQTPAEWLSGDDLGGLDNRVYLAAYGLRKIRQPSVAETLGGHYLAWKPKWDALRSTAQRMNEKNGMLSVGDAARLLDRAEGLLAEIAEIIWLAADAANITLHPHGVKRHEIIADMVISTE